MKSTVLCIVTADDSGSNITTLDGLDPEDYEAIAALVVRSTLNAGGTIRGILEQLEGTHIACSEPAPEPIVI